MFVESLKRIKNKNFRFSIVPVSFYETHTCELGLRKNDIVELGYLQLCFEASDKRSTSFLLKLVEPSKEIKINISKLLKLSSIYVS